MSKKPLQKIKHQIKSGKYYIFWGAATIAVMAGQIYVGNGYRTMSESIRDLTEMIEIKFEYDLHLGHVKLVTILYSGVISMSRS